MRKLVTDTDNSPAKQHSKPKAMRILVVDDNDLLFNALNYVLRPVENYNITLIKQLADLHRLAALYTVLILDLDFNGDRRDSLNALYELLQHRKESKVIICSAFKEAALILAAKNVGAKGYIWKNDSDWGESLQRILRDMQEGIENSFDYWSSKHVRDILSNLPYEPEFRDIKILVYNAGDLTAMQIAVLRAIEITEKLRAAGSTAKEVHNVLTKIVSLTPKDKEKLEKKLKITDLTDKDKEKIKMKLEAACLTAEEKEKLKEAGLTSEDIGEHLKRGAYFVENRTDAISEKWGVASGQLSVKATELGFIYTNGDLIFGFCTKEFPIPKIFYEK